MRHVRLMTVMSSLLSLLSSFVYNIAITRKIPTVGLGLLSLLNASVAFSLLPTAILGFIYPRLVARDGGLNINAALGVSSIFYLMTMFMTIAYLMTVWAVMGRYAYLVLAVALLSEGTYYLQSVTNSILMVKDRGRFVISSILQSITKFTVIPVIMLFHWSVESILWSSFIIVFIPTLYAFIYALRFNLGIHGVRRYFREVINASWVPIMGYAMNSFRSLDAMFIGILGYAQLGVWYVIFILSKPLGYGASIVNITYGELLERGKVDVVYRDLLILLFISTYAALALSLFPGVFLNLVRPGLRSEFTSLALPVVLMAMSGVLGNVNQFISNVMQGVDKRDISNDYVRPGVYLGSLILYTHLAELAFTVVYLATMVPLILLFKYLGFTYYAIIGALVSSLLANITALLFRLNRLRNLKSILNGRGLLRDYLSPLAVSLAALFIIRHYWAIELAPSIYTSLIQVAEVSVIVLLIYVAASLLASSTMRRLMREIMSRILKVILGL
ncbi:MAG: hypothetical protein RXP99_06500 [Vulcanisaeta sp.]